MSWSVANASLALFHHAFDYPVKTEGETLEHIGSYAGHLPFMGDSHLRPDGYGLLDQQLLQSIPISTTKYPRFSGSYEIPAYVDISLRSLAQPPSYCLHRVWPVLLAMLLVSSASGSSCLVRPTPFALFLLQVALLLSQRSIPCAALGTPAAVHLLEPSRRASGLRAAHPASWFVARQADYRINIIGITSLAMH